MGRLLLTSTAVTLFLFSSLCTGIGLKSPSTSSGSNEPLITVFDTKRNVEIVHSGNVKYNIEMGYNGSILGGGELVVGNNLLVGLVEPEMHNLRDGSKTDLQILESTGDEVQVGLFLGSPCIYENGNSGILGPGSTHMSITNILACTKLFKNRGIKHDDIRFLFWKMRDYSLQNPEMNLIDLDDIVVDSNTYLPIMFRGLLHVSALFKYSKKYKNSSSTLLSSLDAFLRSGYVAEIKPIYSDSELKLELNLNVGASLTGSVGTLVKENVPFAIASITKEGKTHMENIVSPCDGSIVWLSERWLQYGKSSGLNASQTNSGYYGNKDYMEEIMLVIKCNSSPSYLVPRPGLKKRYPNDILVSDRFGQVSDWLVKEHIKNSLNLIKVNSKNISSNLRNEMIFDIKATKTLDELRDTLISHMKNFGLELDLLPNLSLPKPNKGEDKERPKEVVLREENDSLERLNDSKLLLRSNMAPKAKMSNFERRVRSGSVPGNTYVYNMEKQHLENYQENQLPVPKWEGLAIAGWNNMKNDEKRIKLKAASYTGKEIQIFGPRPWNLDFLSLDVIRMVSMYRYGDIRYLLSREFLYLFGKFGELDDYNIYTSSLMKYSVEMFVIAGMFVSGEEGAETLLGTVTIEFTAELKNRDPIKINIFSMHTGIVKQVIATSKVACSLDPLVIISSVENEIYNAEKYFEINSDKLDGSYIFSKVPGQRDYLTYPLSQNQKLLDGGNVQAKTDAMLDALNKHTYLFPSQSPTDIPSHSGPIPNLFNIEGEFIEGIQTSRQILNNKLKKLNSEKYKEIQKLQEMFVAPTSDDTRPIFFSSVLRLEILNKWRKSKSKSISNKILGAMKTKSDRLDESFLASFGTKLELSLITNVPNLKTVSKKRSARVVRKLALLEKLKLKRKPKTERELKIKSALIARRVKMLKKMSSQKHPLLDSHSRYGQSKVRSSTGAFPIGSKARKRLLSAKIHSAPSAFSPAGMKIPFYLRQELIQLSNITPKRKTKPASSSKPKKKKPAQDKPPALETPTELQFEENLIKSTVGPTFPFTSNFFLQEEFELEKSSSIGERSTQIMASSDEERFGYINEENDYAAIFHSLKLEGSKIKNLRSECMSYQSSLYRMLDLKEGLLSDIVNTNRLDDAKGILSDVVRLTAQYQECLKKLTGSIMVTKGLEIESRIIRKNFKRKLDKINKVRKNIHNKYKKCKTKLSKAKKSFYSLLKGEISKQKSKNKMDSESYKDLLKKIQGEFKKYRRLEKKCQGIMVNLRKEDMNLSEAKMNRYVMASSYESLLKRNLELFNQTLIYYRVNQTYFLMILSLEKLILLSHEVLLESEYSTLNTAVQQENKLESLMDYYKCQINLDRLRFEEEVAYQDDIIRAGVHCVALSNELLVSTKLLLEVFETNIDGLEAGIKSLLAILSLTLVGSNTLLNSEILKKCQVMARRQAKILAKLSEYIGTTERINSDMYLLSNTRELLNSRLNSLNVIVTEETEESSSRMRERARTSAYNIRIRKLEKKISTKIKLLGLAVSRFSDMKKKFEEQKEQFSEVLNTMKNIVPGLNLDSFMTDTSDVQTSDASRDSEIGSFDLTSDSDSSGNEQGPSGSLMISRISNAIMILDREIATGPSTNERESESVRAKMIKLRSELSDKLEQFKALSGQKKSKNISSARTKLREEISVYVKEAIQLKKYYNQRMEESIKFLKRKLLFSWPRTRLRKSLLDSNRRKKMEENRMRRINKEKARIERHETWDYLQGSTGESEERLLEELGGEGDDIKEIDTSASSLDLTKEKEKATKKEKTKRGITISRRPKEGKKGSKKGIKKGSKGSEDELLRKFGGEGDDIKGVETSLSSLDLTKEKEKAIKEEKYKEKKGKIPKGEVTVRVEGSEKSARESEEKLLEELGGEGDDIKGIDTSASSLDLTKEKENAIKEEMDRKKGEVGKENAELEDNKTEGSSESIIDLVANSIISEMKQEKFKKRWSKQKELKKRKVLDRLRSRIQKTGNKEYSSSELSSDAEQGKGVASRKHGKKGAGRKKSRSDKKQKAKTNGKKRRLGLGKKLGTSLVKESKPTLEIPETQISSSVPESPTATGTPIATGSPMTPESPTVAGTPIAAGSPTVPASQVSGVASPAEVSPIAGTPIPTPPFSPPPPSVPAPAPPSFPPPSPPMPGRSPPSSPIPTPPSFSPPPPPVPAPPLFPPPSPPMPGYPLPSSPIPTPSSSPIPPKPEYQPPPPPIPTLSPSPPAPPMPAFPSSPPPTAPGVPSPTLPSPLSPTPEEVEDKLLEELGGEGDDIKGILTDSSSVDLNKAHEEALEKEKEMRHSGATTSSGLKPASPIQQGASVISGPAGTPPAPTPISTPTISTPTLPTLPPTPPSPSSPPSPTLPKLPPLPPLPPTPKAPTIPPPTLPPTPISTPTIPPPTLPPPTLPPPTLPPTPTPTPPTPPQAPGQTITSGYPSDLNQQPSTNIDITTDEGDYQSDSDDFLQRDFGQRAKKTTEDKILNQEIQQQIDDINKEAEEADI
ncbi:hypothetical protein CPHLJ_1g590 [Cryptosporidium parvum]